VAEEPVMILEGREVQHPVVVEVEVPHPIQEEAVVVDVQTF